MQRAARVTTIPSVSRAQLRGIVGALQISRWANGGRRNANTLLMDKLLLDVKMGLHGFQGGLL